MEGVDGAMFQPNFIFSIDQWGFEGALWMQQGSSPGGPSLSLAIFISGRCFERFTRQCNRRGNVQRLLFGVGWGEVMVSHLQFADDTIIFCDNSQRQIKLLKCVFQCFEVVSGLRLNSRKSSLIAIGEVSNLDQLTVDLECRQGKLPSTYWGLPLGATYKQNEV